MLDSEIAEINKQKGYFVRPKDGLLPEAWQIRLRYV